MVNVILDNVIFSLQQAGGISVYWKELIQRLENETSIKTQFLEPKGSGRNIFREKVPIPETKITYTGRKFLNKFFGRYTNFRQRNNVPTVFHSSYYRIMKGTRVINVVTVHDFIYERKIKTLVGKVHILQKRRALAAADGIICISENTRVDLLKLYPQFVAKRIRVIYNGFNNEDYYPILDAPLEDKVLFVGSRSAYKNFDKVVEMLAELSGISLTIVGEKLESREISMLEKKLGDRYTVYNHIGNEELNALYNESICLLYLSEYEGFGIPVLEAMAAGCPVIALRKSSIPEVVGNAGVLFDSFDNEKILYYIAKLRDDKRFRAQQIKIGRENSMGFSWDKCSQEVAGFYKELYDARFGIKPE